MRRVRKRFLTSLTAAMLAAAALPAMAGPLSDGPTRHGCSQSPKEVRTLRVVTEWPQKTYKPGQIVKVTVTVTRPGPKDPLDLNMELPDIHREPVEGADVSSAVYNVFPPVAGRTETDADGIAVVKFRIPKNMRGEYDVFTDARVYHRTIPAGPDCTDILERGFVYDQRVIKIKS